MLTILLHFGLTAYQIEVNQIGNMRGQTDISCTIIVAMATTIIIFAIDLPAQSFRLLMSDHASSLSDHTSSLSDMAHHYQTMPHRCQTIPHRCQTIPHHCQTIPHHCQAIPHCCLTNTI